MYQLGALFVVLLTLTGCRPPAGGADSTADSFARINETKILRVGYITFPPCVSKNVQDGSLAGHCVATIEEIARQADWRVEYVETNWANFTSGLNARQFDVSIAPTFVTVPRALAVSFTRPLFYAGNSAIARKGETRFTAIETLDQPNLTIAVTDGEAGHEYAKANLKQAKLTVHAGSDQALTFQDVLAGRADVALGDAYVTAKFAAEHPNEVVDLFASNPYDVTPVAWSVRLGEKDLLDFLNASLQALESQGKLKSFERLANAHWLHTKGDLRLD